MINTFPGNSNFYNPHCCGYIAVSASFYLCALLLLWFLCDFLPTGGGEIGLTWNPFLPYVLHPDLCASTSSGPYTSSFCSFSSRWMEWKQVGISRHFFNIDTWTSSLSGCSSVALLLSIINRLHSGHQTPLYCVCSQHLCDLACLRSAYLDTVSLE